MSTHTATQKATLRISLPHQQNPVQGGDKYVSIQMKFLPKHVQKHLSVPNKNICKEKHLSIEPEAEASKPDRNRYAPPCLGRRGFGMKATVLWAPRECAHRGSVLLGVGEKWAARVLPHLRPLWLSASRCPHVNKINKPNKQSLSR